VSRPPRQGARTKASIATEAPGIADRNVPGLAARKAAAKLLAVVIDAKTPLDGLTDNDNGHPHYLALDPRDRSLVRAILTTALRFRVAIGKLLARRLERPLPPNATALSHLLHVAAAQILFLGIPDSAAVDLAVTHAKSDPRTARFAALVNGVLRSLARGKDEELAPALATTLDAPAWFADRLTAAYGKDQASAILAMHRVEAPVDFSVKSDAASWAERFGGIVLPTGGVRVEKLSANVSDLPGFAEGEWWVQDAAAALPARLFGDIAGKRVADLCAAPGGKTAQLVLAGADVTAMDASKNRLARLARNLERLKLRANLVQADLLTYAPEELFDAVLLDAPCSSTGTVRRHPDVPWTKSPTDIEKLAALQARMLRAAAKLVKPGGRVVFSNCSLDPVEGEELYRAFLAEAGNVEHEPIRPGEIPGADEFLTGEGTLRTTPAGMQLGTPGISGLDGFFAARFRRIG
jgi:16S rRNA (cytosine967-C5)-methyltransferase